ncbi:cysteine--tRNA ligase [Candidatus Micrarchaeota archaeon]|nr:cysteine--tRNA ligase [Candidatus Micrarchaeota archaeon]
MFKIYNTLTREINEFKSIKEGTVSLYTCGPTVYNYAHIGNLRTYIFEDLLKRWLLYKGYTVIHIMNITDVDDKTIRDSQKENISLKEFTKKYTSSFFEDIKTLNILPANNYPCATETIPEMIEIIKKLIEKGYAYQGEDKCWYFSVSKFKDYGKLAHMDLSELKSGARVAQDEYEKQQVADFALWKAWDEKDGDVYWETELGKGRPGWHIECTAMSTKYLGNHFDIHCGGVDNMFPHHENEIAQTEAATGETFVNYWLHSEHLIVEGKKMSKSTGNFYTLRDLLNKGYKPSAIRWLMLSTHYREQLNFTFDALKSSTETLQNIDLFIQRIILKEKETEEGKTAEIDEFVDDARNGFVEAMDNDLQISQALPNLFGFINKINTKIDLMKKEDFKSVLEFLKELDSVLGVMKFELPEVPKEVGNLLEQRNKARAEKDWETSDKIRDQLIEMGYEVHDDKGKTKIYKK